MHTCTKPSHAKELFFHIQYKEFPLMHNHDYWEFMFVIKGTLLHTINRQKRELSENTLCLIRPQDVHCIQNKKKQGSQHVNLGMVPNILKAQLDILSPDLYETLLHAEQPIEISLSPTSANRILSDSYKILSADGDAYEMRLHLLFVDIIREFYSYHVKTVPIMGNYSAPVAQLLLMMNNPVNMRRDISGLIQETNYSYSHINRVFTREVGCTPSKFFRNKKFEYAKTLMNDTDMALVDIAETIGYETYSHFSIAFKKYTGVSPYNYAGSKRFYYASKKDRESP